MRSCNLLFAGITFWLVFPSLAQADIFRCVNPGGHVTYSNVLAKGCSRFVSTPKEKAERLAPGTSSRSAPSAAFPRVDGATQRVRDDERRRILNNELRVEEQGLERVRKAIAEQEAPSGARDAVRLEDMRESVALHERNIELLRKEIAAVR